MDLGDAASLLASMGLSFALPAAAAVALYRPEPPAAGAEVPEAVEVRPEPAQGASEAGLPQTRRSSNWAVSSKVPTPNRPAANVESCAVIAGEPMSSK